MADQRIHVGFDNITFPLDNKVVIIEAEEGPIEGAGISWEEFDGHLSVTVEFKPRGMEPIHISLVEDDDGHYEVVTPPTVIKTDTQ